MTVTPSDTPASAVKGAAVPSLSEQTARVLAEAHKTIRSGAPGLSDQTCNVLAGIIARKVSIIYAQPQPSQQAGAEGVAFLLGQLTEFEPCVYGEEAVRKWMECIWPAVARVRAALPSGL